MKKILTLILLLTGILFLTGCMNKFTTVKPKLTDNQIFEKNQECAKYKNELKKEFYDFGSVFYSPYLNTCAIISERSYTKELKKNRMGVIDIFTREGYLIANEGDSVILLYNKTSHKMEPFTGSVQDGLIRLKSQD